MIKTILLRTAGSLALVAALFASAAQPAEARAPQRIGLPAARAQLTLASITRPHHDYPAVDIALPAGTTARAILGGTVTAVFNTNTGGGCGNGVVISRGNLQFTYCHALRTPNLRVGQVVNTFDPILLVGSTGSSTGPHLHIQVKRAGVLVCPQGALRAAWNNSTYDFQTAPRTGCFY